MDLFDNLNSQPKNLLPKEGVVNYYDRIISASDSYQYLERLLNNILWKNDEVVIYGKRITTKRKMAWYGDKPYKYTYSNTTKTALPWNDDLVALKLLIEQQTGETFNSCLLNLYHDGSEGMSWHCDSEEELEKHSAIASLSLGAERKFSFKHKQNKDKVSLFLQSGSLLIMKGETQKNWLHSLPPTKTINSPRVNLTFRTIVD